MVASSAASERNFSAFAFVQTKLRNRLTEAAVVEKLVYVRTKNMQFMNQEQNQHGNLAIVLKSMILKEVTVIANLMVRTKK